MFAWLHDLEKPCGSTFAIQMDGNVDDIPPLGTDVDTGTQVGTLALEDKKPEEKPKPERLRKRTKQPPAEMEIDEEKKKKYDGKKRAKEAKEALEDGKMVAKQAALEDEKKDEKAAKEDEKKRAKAKAKAKAKRGASKAGAKKKRKVQAQQFEGPVQEEGEEESDDDDDDDEMGSDHSDDDEKDEGKKGEGKKKAKAKPKAPVRDQCKSKKFNEIWHSLPGAIQNHFNQLRRHQQTDFIHDTITRSKGRLNPDQQAMFSLVNAREHKSKGKEMMNGYVLEDLCKKDTSLS